MNTRSFLLAAAFGLAMTVVFSCSSDENNGNTPSSSDGKYNYCVLTSEQICLAGPFPSCDAGYPSNECPYGNSPAASGSSSSSLGGGNNPNNQGNQSSQSNNNQGNQNGNSFVDERDGKTYRIETFASYTWMVEDLRFGPGMYTWDEAIDACPNGWYLPDNNEWGALKSDFGSAFLYFSDGTWWSATEGGTDSFRSKCAYIWGANGGLLNGMSGSCQQGSDPSNKSKTYSVRCVKGYVYTLTTDIMPSTAGTISINPSLSRYAQGTVVTVTAAQNSGYIFIKWSGASTSTNASIYLTMNENKSLTAEFEYDTGGVFTDTRDNRIYKYVVIGNQAWMAENLDYDASGSVCYYNQDSYCAQYGRLYNWSATLSACPSGWHLPSYDEWNTLSSYIQSNENCSNCDAKHLKATNGWVWNNNNDGNGIDSYGFAALPGGVGHSDGSFDIGTSGLWWSATERSATGVYYLRMNSQYEYTSWFNVDKSNFISIRCLQD